MIDIATAIEQVQAGRDLTAAQTGHLIDRMLDGQADPQAVARLLLAIRDKGEAVDELVGAATSMRRHMTAIRHRYPVLLDTCGTGGSGSGTFNISTTAAIVAAACGVAVAKHGNRKATSVSGSADVLAELGVAIESDVERVERTLDQVGLCFCFAPKLHPAMKHVVAVRRSLAVPTLFNLLGPLCNPAGATHQLLGTPNPSAQQKIASAIQRLGTVHSVVVRGADGQDEVTLDGVTEVIEIRGAEQRTHRWTADDFGLPTVSASQLQARDPSESAAIIRRILDGHAGPQRDIVVAGAAAALWLVGKAAGLREAAAMAAEAIDSGAAKSKLDELVRAGRNP
ncbi:MAG: anthranilate phosphoribosyltransferase [Planctomycetaceae bacterium]